MGCSKEAPERAKFNTLISNWCSVAQSMKSILAGDDAYGDRRSR